MNPILLISLSENDKRIIIGICIAIILLFVLISFLGTIVVRVMTTQGKKCDTLINDAVVYRIIKSPLQLRKYAAKKNMRHFIKHAWLPLLFILLGGGMLIIHNAINGDWSYNPFNMSDGFGTLVLTLDWHAEEVYSEFFGMTVLSNWPPIDNTPHFVSEAIYAYLFVIFAGIGVIWYLIVSQAYLARALRASKLSKTIFEKSLDNFNQNSPIPPITGA